MKGTDQFKSVIQKHLNGLAGKDPLFAETLKKPKKNINDCVTYILNTVKSSGNNGFADDEIFGMAVHYYDEDDIKVGNPISGKVVVNHSSKKSNTSSQPAKKVPEAKSSTSNPESTLSKKPTKKPESKVIIPSLFD